MPSNPCVRSARSAHGHMRPLRTIGADSSVVRLVGSATSAPLVSRRLPGLAAICQSQVRSRDSRPVPSHRTEPNRTGTKRNVALSRGRGRSGPGRSRIAIEHRRAPSSPGRVPRGGQRGLGGTRTYVAKARRQRGLKGPARARERSGVARSIQQLMVGVGLASTCTVCLPLYCMQMQPNGKPLGSSAPRPPVCLPRCAVASAWLPVYRLFRASIKTRRTKANGQRKCLVLH